MYKIQVARVKLSNLISKFRFINTNQLSIHLFPVMHFCALHLHSVIKYAGIKKGRYFDVLLTVHLSIILVINQLNAQILLL